MTAWCSFLPLTIINAWQWKEGRNGKGTFPSREDIFLVNYQIGDSKKVEC